jgi:DNA-binding CsgD family transcriptional regulator
MLSMALFIQGWNQELTGDYAASKKSLEESLEVSRAEGNVFGVALSAMEGAWLEQALGNTEAAAPLEDEAQMLLTALDSVGLDYLNLSLMARGRLARGDIAAAHRILNSADESAMAPGRWTRARFWFAQASLRRHAGAYEEAERKAHEALAAQRQISDKVGIVDSLELLAAVASALESHEEAGRLLGAAAALRDSIGYVRTPPETPGHLALVAAVRAGLGEERLRQAQAEGAVMSVDDALAYASRGRGARKRPTRGWRSITPTEERVIQQVVAGLSNSQIGERLFVSRETIKTHLSSIFGKLGVSTRAELAALASRRGS